MARSATQKMTAVTRSLADSARLAQRGDFDANPAAHDAVVTMVQELKSLRSKVNLLYLATTIAAFLILSQPTTGEISFELIGLKMPLSVLSKQAISIIMAGAFGYYLSALVSATLLYGTLMLIFQRAAPEGWEYLIARYDADLLWTTLLRPKALGYTATKWERFVSLIVQITNGAVVTGHLVLVMGAIFAAGVAALAAKSKFGIALSALAIIGSVGAILGALGALYIKVDYEAPKPTEAT
jgi:hypothetical protein